MASASEKRFTRNQESVRETGNASSKKCISDRSLGVKDVENLMTKRNQRYRCLKHFVVCEKFVIVYKLAIAGRAACGSAARWIRAVCFVWVISCDTL